MGKKGVMDKLEQRMRILKKLIFFLRRKVPGWLNNPI